MLTAKPPVTDLTKAPWFFIAPFFFLGTSMVAMKAVLPETTPLFLAGFRLVPAGLLILGMTVAFKLPQPKTWQAWSWIGLFALIDAAMFQGFLTTGLVRTGAGLGAVLIDAQPLVVAILSRFLFGEIIGLWGWLGLSIGLVGISLCGLPQDWLTSIFQGNLRGLQVDGTALTGAVTGALTGQGLLQSGELLMVLAALAMSLGTIIIRYVKVHADVVVATGWHMLLGGLPLFLLSGLWETDQISHLDMTGWSALGYATLFGTALTYGIFFYLAATGNLTSVSALIFLTPIFAMVFSTVFLGEALTQLQWIGVVLTLVSVVLVIQRQAIAQAITAKLSAESPESPESLQSLESPLESPVNPP